MDCSQNGTDTNSIHKNTCQEGKVYFRFNFDKISFKFDKTFIRLRYYGRPRME